MRYVAVVGPGDSATANHEAVAHELGHLLGAAGAVVLTGGHDGVMRAAAAGCRAAGGTSIAILPGRDRSGANEESTYTLPTGMGELRNGLIVRAANAVICVALSWGTLSEVALAVRTGIPVVSIGDPGLPLAGIRAAASARAAVDLALGSDGPVAMAAPPIHHLTLSVTDVTRSAQWYQRLLGRARRVQRAGPTWQRIRLDWPSGLVIALTQHARTSSADRFDEVRVGLDHVGLSCAGAAEVRGWAERLDAMGAERGPVEDLPYGWAVTGRDPDQIPVEFFAPR